MLQSITGIPIEKLIPSYLEYALEFIGKEYVWGGLDCSGFVQEVLACVGLDPQGDQSAQGLYNALLKEGWKDSLLDGLVLFFGKNIREITHTAIAINNSFMVESGGGGPHTMCLEDSVRQCAFVRIRPIRQDLVAHLHPIG